MILLGLDPFAARVAQVLAAEIDPNPRTGAVVCESSGGNVVADLRRCVLGLTDEARARGESFEPHLSFLVTASAPEGAAALKALCDSCAMLQTVCAGNQSIALVVLVSSATAEDATKCADFAFFVALEELVGELPFVQTVFVNQLVQKADPSGEVAVSEELQTLLAGELLDPDLCQVIASLGHSAVDWRTRVAGRKACYSTLGRYLLEYRPDDALAYLSGRLQRQLLEQGLADPERVDEEARNVIQARVDQNTQDWLSAIAKRLPPAPTVNLGSLADASEGHERSRLLAAMPAEIERAFNALGPQLGLLELVDGWTRRALLDFLPLVPAHLAGAMAFIDAMLGRQITDDANRASGLVATHRALCRHALDRSIWDVGSRLLNSIDAAAAPEQRQPQEISLAWLVQTAETLAQVASAKLPSAAASARLLAALLKRVMHWSEEGNANPLPMMSIVEDLADMYLREAENALADETANRQQHADIAHSLEALPASYGVIGRTLTRRKAFHAELAELQGQRARLDQQHMAFGSVRSRLRDVADAVMNGVVLPQLLRQRVDACMRRDAEQTAAELRAFVAAVSDGVQACWARGVEAGQEGRTAIGSRLLSCPRLEALYATTLQRGQIGLPQAVAGLLGFVPRAVPAAAGRGQSYRDCSGLADHYIRGPKSLLDRMADYSHQQCSWVVDLDALDVVECQGKALAAGFLQEVSHRTQHFLELSPGLLPLTRDAGCAQVIFVVRTADDVASRLDANYSAPTFAPNIRFVDSGNRRKIEVTGLVLGFPAFLIHGLHEGRQLRLAASRVDRGDLWPC